MPPSISYMGTKRQLSSLVAKTVAGTPDGSVLDLFAGIGSVGMAMKDSRPLWSNDVQFFANLVSETLFCTQVAEIESHEAIQACLPHFLRNLKSLDDRWAQTLHLENVALQEGDLRQLRLLTTRLETEALLPKLRSEHQRLAKKPTTKPYRLFSLLYGGGNFSLRQCTEIDSIRSAIDQTTDDYELDAEYKNWMLLALCQAASKVGNTTGHFAQYLNLSSGNLRRSIAQKKRSVWNEWLRALDECKPVGSVKWRKRNRAYRFEAIELLDYLYSVNIAPAVIYADPPYTSDQYSRYYHLLETILLYDYPRISGVGRYRENRFISSFSCKKSVSGSIYELIQKSSRLGSALVLSYPLNGLLSDSRTLIEKELRNTFTNVNIEHEIPHLHSSMGASKGVEKYQVTEVIYSAYH